MQTNNFNPREILKEIQFEQLKKHPNILIAAAFWEPERYEAAKTCYRFMRKIDDMIDDRKADIQTLDDCEKSLFTNQVQDWIACLQGNAIDDSSFSKVIKIVSDYNIPLNLFSNFAKSMIYDIHNDGFPTFESFLEYAEGAAVTPASVFLHLCCLNENNESYAKPSMDLLELARPCAIFSYLVHIIRDFQIDQQHNLNYFADDILKENNLKAEDLKLMVNGGTIDKNFRQVVKTYLNYAEEYKRKTEIAIQQLEPFLSQRYILSLRIIYRLYLEIYNRIDPEHGLFKTADLTPTSEETKQIVEETILTFADAQK
nr:squalene/phytoene synthase family protein [Bacteroidota bacterium]